MYSADELAEALQLDRPTPQQRAVIEAPLAPTLVVAGAGSGKTATMASRVVYLLANGMVAPHEILGLTFTRKATLELAERVRLRIRQLASAGIASFEYDPFELPVVSTYNSFANALYRDNAAFAGMNPDGVLLREAAAWQLARQVVIESDDPVLSRLDVNANSLAEIVHWLAQDLAEHETSPEAVMELVHEFVQLKELPNGGRGKYAQVDGYVDDVVSLEAFLALAAEFTRRKLHRSLVEFADQVVLALRIVTERPDVAEVMRGRHKVVILDEYQDTSHIQTRLLSTLFSGTAVTAVGDPNQAIYGWRGASAAGLAQFATQFQVAPEHRYSLSVSWRNDVNILRAANTVIAPLDDQRFPVPELTASPVARAGEVRAEYFETVQDEAAAVATWFANHIQSVDVPDYAGAENPSLGPATGRQVARQPTMALLLRDRKHQDAFLARLREKGVPYHVLGVSGLLTQPAIADLVSLLSVISDTANGTYLVRLLAGSRWRIGTRDLRMLRELAAWLLHRDYAGRRLEDEARRGMDDSLFDEEQASIVEALDFIARTKPNHRALADFSAAGLPRLRDAGNLLSRLRREASGELPELVASCFEALNLDIELFANEAVRSPRASYEAFIGALNEYLAIAQQVSLAGFLGWLEQAQKRDRLAPRQEAPEENVVQVLTVHGAKGLEWDHVAIPRVVEGDFPSGERSLKGWVAKGKLPYEFRGDYEALPKFSWRSAATRREVRDNFDAFRDSNREAGLAEERRLFYVALTRARHQVFLTGSFWAGEVSKAREPSMFLQELAVAELVDEPRQVSSYETNPLLTHPEKILWPSDPLGVRRAAVTAAAQMVAGADPDAETEWDDTISALLSERAAAVTSQRLVPLPERIPASRFKDFVTAPEQVAAALLRPMPRQPHREARLGTAFHAWVEQRLTPRGTQAPLDAALGLMVDGLEGEREQLELLAKAFENSRFGGLAPVSLEREINLDLGFTTIVCKLDAVFRRGEKLEIVDWKTGRPPQGPQELEQAQLQLALYRAALATADGVPEEQIVATLYYVAAGKEITPKQLPGRAELAQRLLGVTVG